jgi:hypothetical protein
MREEGSHPPNRTGKIISVNCNRHVILVNYSCNTVGETGLKWHSWVKWYTSVFDKCIHRMILNFAPLGWSCWHSAPVKRCRVQTTRFSSFVCKSMFSDVSLTIL